MLSSTPWKRWLLLAIAIAIVAIYLFPLYWMYVTALKTNTETFANPPTLWPHHPELKVTRVWNDMGMDTFIRTR